MGDLRGSGGVMNGSGANNYSLFTEGGHSMSDWLHNETHLPESSDTELYVVIGILSFLSLMGSAGNILVLYVFSQKKDKLVSTLFIIVLAFVDFVTCLIVLPYTMYMEYVGFAIHYDILCKLYQFLITSNIPFSALIMVAIAIDRYFCICHPFLHAMNLQRAKILIACLAMFAAGLGIIVGLMFGCYQDITMMVPTNQTSSTLNNSTASIHTAVQFDTEFESSPGMQTQTATYYTIDDDKLQTNKSHDLPDDMEHVGWKRMMFTGKCESNELILGQNFQWYFQKFYTGMYFVCLGIVIILYTLIYRSVLARRTKRSKQKSKTLNLVIQSQSERNGDTTCTEETTMLTTVNGESNKEAIKNGGTTSKAKEKARRKSTKRDKNRMANLKTAAMLFVVTVVFIVTFFPAFMMALFIIPYNMIVFYMYFANNVANPVIYSFMNKNFRDDLRRIFCSR